MNNRFLLGAMFCCRLCLCHAACAQTAPNELFVKSHYNKMEFRVAMRDGVRLYTVAYIPKSGVFPDRGPYPILLTRTPYSAGPYGPSDSRTELGPSDDFERAGYVFVYQEVRGRFRSGGTFVEMRPHISIKRSRSDTDESSDTYDTVEFLLRHIPNNNRRIGLVGISYPGFYVIAGLIDAHPAIKAASPQAPIANLFLSDDAYHGGAFMLAANFEFYSGFWQISSKLHQALPFKSPDLYSYFLKAGPTSNLDRTSLTGKNRLFHDQLVHETYDDYWQVRDVTRNLKNVHCPVLTVAGWFDADDLAGPFNIYHALDQNDPGYVNSLVVGPWIHGGWAHNDGDQVGNIVFQAKTAEFFRKQIEFPFFEFYLKDEGKNSLAKATVFETGTNVWKKYDAWPPRTAVAKRLYFRTGGRLSFDPPVPGEGEIDTYVSDPALPVPFTEYISDSVPGRYMTDDQRFASRRPDVLTYETEPLSEDVTIVGPVSPRLVVASTGTDSDFVVKLIDVYPEDERGVGAMGAPLGGYEQLVRGEPMRAKFRNSWQNPEPLVPGKITDVEFSMPDINHTFRRGHRLMVQVQSSWFPLVDRNPQTFTDIPFAKPEEFVKATEAVYHSPTSASTIKVFVMPKEPLHKF